MKLFTFSTSLSLWKAEVMKVFIIVWDSWPGIPRNIWNIFYLHPVFPNTIQKEKSSNRNHDHLFHWGFLWNNFKTGFTIILYFLPNRELVVCLHSQGHSSYKSWWSRDHPLTTVSSGLLFPGCGWPNERKNEWKIRKNEK